MRFTDLQSDPDLKGYSHEILVSFFISMNKYKVCIRPGLGLFVILISFSYLNFF
jgi:hypothetical protein